MLNFFKRLFRLPKALPSFPASSTRVIGVTLHLQDDSRTEWSINPRTEAEESEALQQAQKILKNIQSEYEQAAAENKTSVNLTEFGVIRVKDFKNVLLFRRGKL
jgi:hypothetical protein